MFEEEYLTLSQLNRQIRAVLDRELAEDFWVIAEVGEISPRGRRHCYMQLVEKEDDAVIAQSRATLWSSRCFLLDEFEAITGETLKAGMEVLLRVRVRFHEVYGLSLDVTSLNPVYTLGGMARKKRETIERLTTEGLLDRNRSLPFPLVPQRLALVTSPTAAGLGDFTVHLKHNPGGYVFSTALFACAVQGAEAEAQLVAALREVRERAGLFDVVVILRGGGSQVDLSCFDSYALAVEIARCPLPVFTGIGHEKDDTVADLVAHTRAKTPTAAAELLLGRVLEFEAHVVSLGRCVAADAAEMLRERTAALRTDGYRLSTAVGRQTAQNARRLESTTRAFGLGATAALAGSKERLAELSGRLRFQPAQAILRRSVALAVVQQRTGFAARLRLERAGDRVARFEADVRNLDPVNVLRRGYSITRLCDSAGAAGRVLRAADGAPVGAALETRLALGTLHSTVTSADCADRELVWE